MFEHLLNINYQIIYEENYLEPNEIILWEENLYFKEKTFKYNDKELLKYLKKENILIGCSTNWSEYIKYLESNFNINIMEYENSETILFERV